jgi:uncharacterized DUF497 family protein
VNRIPQSNGGGNKKTSPKATDNSRYAGSFVKRNRRRIIVGREDKSALNNEEHPGEERYNILGRVGKVLFVVCTLREKNTVRIISARTASLPERERYEDGECEF